MTGPTLVSAPLPPAGTKSVSAAKNLDFPGSQSSDLPAVIKVVYLPLKAGQREGAA
jgi:hypothetical protein